MFGIIEYLVKEPEPSHHVGEDVWRSRPFLPVNKTDDGGDFEVVASPSVLLEDPANTVPYADGRATL
jgi:hypothetical protein